MTTALRTTIALLTMAAVMLMLAPVGGLDSRTPALLQRAPDHPISARIVAIDDQGKSHDPLGFDAWFCVPELDIKPASCESQPYMHLASSESAVVERIRSAGASDLPEQEPVTLVRRFLNTSGSTAVPDCELAKCSARRK